MAVFLRRRNMFPGLSLGKMPGIPTHLNVNMFFDRAAVKSALTQMEYVSLSRASLLVRRTAQKSIRKVGAANTRLKVMKDNPKLSLAQIANLPGLRKSTRDGIAQRIREIKFPPASPPGTPPYTHVPSSHMLGFRRNLYNGYDKITHSAVAGPFRRGDDWTIPMLHEFGGSKKLSAYVWKPKYPRYNNPIVKWFTQREKPGNDWIPTGQTQNFRYPDRPYMKTALRNCRPRLASMFRGVFSAGVIRGPQ